MTAPLPLVVLGLDAAWGGLGWCVATKDGPYAAGWGAPGRRPARRIEDLAGLLEVARGRVDAIARGQGARIVVAVEEPPPVFMGQANKTAIGVGLGRAIGATTMFFALRLPLATIEDIPIATWRGWWRPLVRGRKREELKASAVAAVRTLGWASHLPSKGGKDAPADVAEAILLAVGRARNGERQLTIEGTRR